MSGGREEAEVRLLHRLVYFSDAVFAIVLTLLALELRPPEIEGQHGLFAALVGMSSHFIAFASSFALVSIFWIAHLSMLKALEAFDWLVAWVNLAFLLIICVMPFASALLGEHGVFGEAWRLYAAVLVAASLMQCLLLAAIFRGGGRLTGGFDGRDFRYRLMRAFSPGAVFGVGLVLSLAGLPQWAALCWLLFLPMLLGARALFGPRKASKPAPEPEPEAAS